jgi:hypothetical protein
MRSTLRFASSTSSQRRFAPRWPNPSSCGPTCPPLPPANCRFRTRSRRSGCRRRCPVGIRGRPDAVGRMRGREVDLVWIRPRD